jgi:hypothetical protein
MRNNMAQNHYPPPSGYMPPPGDQNYNYTPYQHPQDQQLNTSQPLQQSFQNQSMSSPLPD